MPSKYKMSDEDCGCSYDIVCPTCADKLHMLETYCKYCGDYIKKLCNTCLGCACCCICICDCLIDGCNGTIWGTRNEVYCNICLLSFVHDSESKCTSCWYAKNGLIVKKGICKGHRLTKSYK